MRTLILITLIILSLWAVMPTHAQDSQRNAVNTCVSADMDTLWLSNNTTVHPNYLRNLTGKRVVWGGYAYLNDFQKPVFWQKALHDYDRVNEALIAQGKTWEWLENNLWWYAEKTEVYGYIGVNIFDLDNENALIGYGYQGRNNIIERWTFTPYLDNQYFITETTLIIYADLNGEHLDYHIVKGADNRPCMFLVDAAQVLAFLNN